MARIVRHVATGPIKIEPPTNLESAKPLWICACGISKTFPLCDKSHQKCRAEEPGTTYVYDPVTGDVIEKRCD